MNTLSVLQVVAGAVLIWWALTELRIIGPNQSLSRDSSGNRAPGGYVSPPKTAP